MKRPRVSRILAISAAVAAGVASFGGLFVASLYNDNAFTTIGWWGTDVATVFVAVPATLLLVGRRSVRARLVLLGLLDYLLYNAAFYAFGAHLNALFLAYVATMSLATFALIFTVAELDLGAVEPRFPRRGVAGFFLVLGAGLASVEVAQVLAFAVGGKVPDVVANTGHPTHVVAALDLTLVVPFLFLAGVLLLKRNVWGLVVGVVLGVKGAVYMTGLTLATIRLGNAGFNDAAAQLPIWAAIGVGSAIATGVLLANVRERSVRQDAASFGSTSRAA